jgi:preprotein translocase subunit SecY
MDIPQSLQTIAEISIAFAGFSGLVIALRRKAGPLTDVHKYRLRVLLTLAFGAMFLSLLPEILSHYGTGPDTLWARCSLAAMLFSAAFLGWWLLASRRTIRLVPEIFDWFAVSRMATGHTVILILLLGSTGPWLADYGPGPYITALVWYLMHAAQQFSRMLFIQPKSDQAQDNR